jgi:molecular chaperone GrpE
MDKKVKDKETESESGPGTPVEELTAARFEQLKAQAAKADENWDKFVRLTADFENYKKRAARERQDAVSFANENLLVKLLPILDAFEMALAAAPADAAAQSHQAGIVHEAVSEQETADAPEGQVIRQLRKGYKFRNRLIRPAGVVVAKKPAA